MLVSQNHVFFLKIDCIKADTLETELAQVQVDSDLLVWPSSLPAALLLCMLPPRGAFQERHWYHRHHNPAISLEQSCVCKPSLVSVPERPLSRERADGLRRPSFIPEHPAQPTAASPHCVHLRQSLGLSCLLVGRIGPAEAQAHPGPALTWGPKRMGRGAGRGNGLGRPWVLRRALAAGRLSTVFSLQPALHRVWHGAGPRHPAGVGRPGGPAPSCWRSGAAQHFARGHPQHLQLLTLQFGMTALLSASPASPCSSQVGEQPLSPSLSRVARETGPIRVLKAPPAPMGWTFCWAKYENLRKPLSEGMACLRKFSPLSDSDRQMLSLVVVV